MAHKPSRRQFLQTTTATGIGYWVAGSALAQESNSPNERVAMAAIGIGGKGSSDTRDAAKRGDLVAICDVDERRFRGADKRYPKAKVYTDFRKMLDEMGDSIDAVTVSTPDHTHTPAALMAMRMGKHCFCQKPLTRTIYEARLLGKVAKEQGVATQMGNQGTAERALRKGAAVVQAGGLGEVNEVHVWTNRPVWPQGGPLPEEAEVPQGLHWDEWIGPAAMRPYANGYHPFKWRGYWDFGTGALGDMACHVVNLPFAALNLRDPVSVQAQCSGHNKESFPKWSIITFEFPATDTRPAVKMVWYDGGKRPPRELIPGHKPGKNGSIMIGEKGTMFSNHTYGGRYVVLGDIEEPTVEYKQSPGHFTEWVEAIKGGEPAMSNFPDYSSALTETILLGNLAVWTAEQGEGPKVEWDAKNMKSTNIEGLEPLITPTYRKGYLLDV